MMLMMLASLVPTGGPPPPPHNQSPPPPPAEIQGPPPLRPSGAGEARRSSPKAAGPRCLVKAPQRGFRGSQDGAGRNDLAGGRDVGVAHAVALVGRHALPKTGMHRLESR